MSSMLVDTSWKYSFRLYFTQIVDLDNQCISVPPSAETGEKSLAIIRDGLYQKTGQLV